MKNTDFTLVEPEDFGNMGLKGYLTSTYNDTDQSILAGYIDRYSSKLKYVCVPSQCYVYADSMSYQFIPNQIRKTFGYEYVYPGNYDDFISNRSRLKYHAAKLQNAMRNMSTYGMSAMKISGNACQEVVFDEMIPPKKKQCTCGQDFVEGFKDLKFHSDWCDLKGK